MRSADGHNPLCGDRLTVSLRLAGDTIEDIRFEGKGCAISTASASMMSEAVKGRDRAAVQRAVQRACTPCSRNRRRRRTSRWASSRHCPACASSPRG